MEEVQVCIRGEVDGSWSDWMAGLKVNHTEDGETVLTGVIPDQSALYGLLIRLSDLGLHLVSVSSWRLKKEQGKEVGIGETVSKNSN